MVKKGCYKLFTIENESGSIVLPRTPSFQGKRQIVEDHVDSLNANKLTPKNKGISSLTF